MKSLFRESASAEGRPIPTVISPREMTSTESWIPSSSRARCLLCMLPGLLSTARNCSRASSWCGTIVIRDQAKNLRTLVYTSQEFARSHLACLAILSQHFESSLFDAEQISRLGTISLLSGPQRRLPLQTPLRWSCSSSGSNQDLLRWIICLRLAILKPGTQSFRWSLLGMCYQRLE